MASIDIAPYLLRLFRVSTPLNLELVRVDLARKGFVIELAELHDAAASAGLVELEGSPGAYVRGEQGLEEDCDRLRALLSDLVKGATNYADAGATLSAAVAKGPPPGSDVGEAAERWLLILRAAGKLDQFTEYLEKARIAGRDFLSR